MFVIWFNLTVFAREVDEVEKVCAHWAKGRLCSSNCKMYYNQVCVVGGGGLFVCVRLNQHFLALCGTTNMLKDMKMISSHLQLL